MESEHRTVRGDRLGDDGKPTRFLQSGRPRALIPGASPGHSPPSASSENPQPPLGLSRLSRPTQSAPPLGIPAAPSVRPIRPSVHYYTLPSPVPLQPGSCNAIHLHTTHDRGKRFLRGLRGGGAADPLGAAAFDQGVEAGDETWDFMVRGALAFL
jgi:hypothetical protein